MGVEMLVLREAAAPGWWDMIRQRAGQFAELHLQRRSGVFDKRVGFSIDDASSRGANIVRTRQYLLVAPKPYMWFQCSSQET